MKETPDKVVRFAPYLERRQQAEAEADARKVWKACQQRMGQEIHGWLGKHSPRALAVTLVEQFGNQAIDLIDRGIQSPEQGLDYFTEAFASVEWSD